MILALLFAFVLETVSEVAWENGPKGLSGVTYAGGERYFAVSDRDGKVIEFSLGHDGGELGKPRVAGEIALEGLGKADLEGCALDPLVKNRIWTADEKSTALYQHSLPDGKRISSMPLGKVFVSPRINRSLESLSISPDGLEMWTANEDTLKGDGEVATRSAGGKVRLQRFVRAAAGKPWKPDRQIVYATDPVGGEKFAGAARSGVSDVLALGKGGLLVLEREFSRKNPIFPDFRLRIYRVKGNGKKLVWEKTGSFANYEGMCFGPVLPDGAKSVVLVSDGGDEALRMVMNLAVRPE